jgi:Nuclear pore complex scaffold, nucleoporins 186/192/205
LTNFYRNEIFPQGNKLLPPGESSSDGLIGLHARLNPDAHEDWHRKDIWGLLAASYALLLRSSPLLVSSPRAGMPMPSFDARGASHACLELPAELKSFTFARLSLIPALQRLGNARPNLSELCDNSEFFLSVLAEFVSHYFDVLMDSGDVPISRSRWEQDEKEGLRLLVMQQQQHRSFQQWTGTSAGETEVIPSSVDLLKRPDCMDDVIALAVAMCSLGPDYARCFWSTSGGEDDWPTPSRALVRVERLQGIDEALLPCYLSLLSSLACSENGAAAVHDILSRSPDSADGSSVSTFVNWPAIVATIRWYAKELMPLDYDGVSSSKTSTSAMPGSGTTAYYYFNESVSLSSSSMQSREVPSSNSSPSKPKELGDQHAVILSAHLALIMNVASKSAAARCAILSIKLPIVTGGSLDGGDETLLVLFALAQAPLSPELRGATLTTISCLLQVADATPEQDKQIRSTALTGWDCLESCQFLPISMLEQYPHDIVSSSEQRRVSMGFPPSSTTLVSHVHA